MYSSTTILLKLIILLTIVFLQYVFGDIYIMNGENSSVDIFLDYKITYTPSIPEDGIYGSLAEAIPKDACEPLTPPPNDSTITNWFVLAYRATSLHSRCSNKEKIHNAAKAGYRVIILYSPNDLYHTPVPYTPFERNYYNYEFEDSNVTIPGVLVAHEDGTILQKKYLYMSGYRLQITSDSPPNFSYYLIPFAIVIGAGVLIIFSYLIFQCMMCMMERRRAQRHRLSKKYLKKLTLQKFEKGIFYETCAICLDDYVEGEKIRILPCNHAYHQKCIDPWLTKNRRVCPVCKAKVTLPGMEEYTDSDSDNDGGRRLQSNDNVNETTRLISAPSSSRHHNNNSRNARNLRSFSLLIDNNRNDSTTSTMPNAPTTTTTTNTTRSSRSSNNHQSSSTIRYELLDDSLFQPGPSTSAPIISELSSNNNNNNRDASNSRRNNNKRKKKRNTTNRPNVQVVIADVQPLIAPPQLSINCDSESERPLTPVDEQEQSSSSSRLQQTSNSSTSSSSRRSNNRISVDQIV